MKLKYTLVFTIISFFITTAGFSQQYSDQEIGFDMERMTTLLKEHGIKDEHLSQEISIMREAELRQYIEMKKIQDSIYKRANTRQQVPTSTNRSAAITDIPQTEKDALLALYNSTNGANWGLKTGWDFSKPVTSWNNSTRIGWYGITVGPNGRVTAIVLNGNSLSGTIPMEIGQFPELTYLRLSNNQINGEIPTQIGQLTKLQNLDLGSNQISKSIPDEIGGLIQLITLYLNDNKLIGPIPPEIGLLNKLELLDLSTNNLESIPVEIGKLTKLISLSISRNKLKGSILKEIGELTNLKRLYLNNNMLEGSIPTEIGKLSQLNVLFLSYNKLNDIVPPAIEQCTELTTLLLYNNNLSGPITKEIGKLNKLASFMASSNRLSGPIPLELYQCANLETLGLGSNILNGIISPQIGRLLKISYLELSSNNFEGSIPIEIANLTKLRSLWLYSNRLEGAIPNLTNLTLLKDLRISLNKFRFADFAEQYQSYKSQITKFEYNVQAKTDNSKTLNIPNASSVTLKMFEDDRFTPQDTFQWYKAASPKGQLIEGATSREFTISNFTGSDAGKFYCISKNTEITNPINPFQSLVLEREPITLNVISCTTIPGSLKANTENMTLFSTGSFKLETTATNLTYSWTVTYPDNSKSEANPYPEFSHYFQNGAGLYIISLKVTDANGCEQTFEKRYTLEYDCRTGPITTGRIMNLSSSGNFDNPQVLINTPSVFSFYSWGNNFSDKKFSWELVKSTGEPVSSGATEEFSFTATALGDYILKLIVSDDRTGCDYNFSKNLTVVDVCTYTIGERYGAINFEYEFSTGALSMNINQTKNLFHNFMYNEQKSGYNYHWELYDPNNILIGSADQKIFPITLTKGGYHKVTVDVEDAVTRCVTKISKTVNSLISNSCTSTNPKSLIIKGLYIDLIKNLIARSIMGETDEQINASPAGPEFIALKPYITNGPKDKIYHYKTTRIQQGEGAETNNLRAIEFSFSPDQLADNHVSFQESIYYDPQEYTYEDLLSSIDRLLYYDLEQYTSADTPLISCQVNNYSRMKAKTSVKPDPGECDKETTIHNINFCPEEECPPIVGTMVVSGELTSQTTSPNPVNASAKSSKTATNRSKI